MEFFAKIVKVAPSDLLHFLATEGPSKIIGHVEKTAWLEGSG